MDLRTTHGLITALRSKRWQQEVEVTWGVLGNGAGTVETSRTNYYYVLPQGLQRVAQAINLGHVPPIPELVVELAEKDGAYAILGPAVHLPYWGDADPYLPLHGSTHEAGEGEGRDPVNVYLRAIVPFRADEHSPANDSLVVAAGIYYNEETLGYQYFTGGNSPAFNLASSGSVSGSGFYRWDLLYLDIPSNTLQILQGTEGPEGLIEHPDPPWSGSTASIPITYVYQSYGSATVAEADLLDARQIVTGIGIPQNAGWLRGYEICSGSPPSDGEYLMYSTSLGCWVPSSATVGSHDLLDGATHPDTAAQAVTRGSLIYGNSTPAWDELVVGGAHQLFKVNVGGTEPAWASFDWDEISAAAAADMVHDHSAAGEGGQLDWDAIWSDAVHDHSAAGEGGQVDVPDLTDSLGQLLTGVQRTDLTDGGVTVLHSHPGSITYGLHWHVDGPLTTGSWVGEARIAPTSGSIVEAWIFCQTTGSAGSTIVDFNQHPFGVSCAGTTIFANQANRPSLAAGDADCRAISGSPSVVAITKGDAFSIDMDQVAAGAIGDLAALLIVEAPGAGGGAGAGTIEIQEDDVKVADADTINFEGGGGKVVNEGGGKVTVDITPGGGGATEDQYGNNLVKNSPGQIVTDGAEPQWWDDTTDATITDEDTAGEGIPDKHERCFKVVTTEDNEEGYQVLTFADEELLDAGVTVVSFGCWVYCTSANKASIAIMGANLGLQESAQAGANAWEWLTIENITLHAADASISLYLTVDDGTAYYTMPILCVNGDALPWKPRGIKHVPIAGVTHFDLNTTGDVAWSDTDCTANTDPLAVGIDTHLLIYEPDGVVGSTLDIGHDSALTGGDYDVNVARCAIVAHYWWHSTVPNIRCDDSQVIRYRVSEADADSDVRARFNIHGYWMWE